MTYEEEWYSVCCTAPPLYELHDNGEYEPVGICMHCRDNTTFELIEEENDEWEVWTISIR